MNTSQVTRVEVIDDNGRSYSLHTASNVVVQLQDRDRTLKVFTNGIAQMVPKKPAPFDLAKAMALSDETLANAFVLLYGPHWKRDWNDASKAREMRSIFDGGTQPCAPFEKWVTVVNFIQDQLS